MKKGFLLTEIRMGRRVLVGPFRVEADGRLVLREDEALKVADRAVYAPGAHERARRKEDPAFDHGWTEIEKELLRRKPGAILRSEWAIYYDFTGAPDLLERWERLLDGAKEARRPEEPPTRHFRRVGELLDRYAALVALRAPESYREAPRKGVGTFSLLARHPDLEAKFDADLRALPPGDSTGRSAYYLQELPWKNPLPERGLSGAELSDFWAWADSVRMQRKRQLQASRHDRSESYRRWCRERWTQIGMLEAILDLLHRILAPGTAFCGQDCSHLQAGLSPAQAKRFLDALDAFRAITDYESEENYTAEYVRAEMARRLAAKGA